MQTWIRLTVKSWFILTLVLWYQKMKVWKSLRSLVFVLRYIAVTELRVIWSV